MINQDFEGISYGIIEKLSLYSPGKTEENYGKLHSGCATFLATFEPSTYPNKSQGRYTHPSLLGDEDFK
jgi:hypothetical protein